MISIPHEEWDLNKMKMKYKILTCTTKLVVFKNSM